jgi:hypothetical protein
VTVILFFIRGKREIVIYTPLKKIGEIIFNKINALTIRDVRPMLIPNDITKRMGKSFPLLNPVRFRNTHPGRKKETTVERPTLITLLSRSKAFMQKTTTANIVNK